MERIYARRVAASTWHFEWGYYEYVYSKDFEGKRLEREVISILKDFYPVVQTPS